MNNYMQVTQSQTLIPTLYLVWSIEFHNIIDQENMFL